MREYSAPAVTTVADDENITDIVWVNAERFGDTVTFRRQVDGSWRDVTAADFAHWVTAVANGLIDAGIEPGDRVGLMSKTRFEWTLLDFGIWSAGAISVPVYDTSSAEQLHWILSDSGAKAVIVETDAHVAVLDTVRDQLPALEHSWQIDGPEPAIDLLTAHDEQAGEENVRSRRRAVRADDTATIVYTSGTTGRPKGVALTHRNLLAEVRANMNAFPQLMDAGNSLLLFLPLAHIFARAITLTAVASRATLGHTPNIDHLTTDLSTFRPTFVVGVPRVFEKVYNSAKLKAHTEGKGTIFNAAETTAIAYSQAQETADGPGLIQKLKHAVFDKLVYAKLRAALGGRCIAAVAGGAPLGTRLAHFFRGVGVPVYEGYGLTETTAAVSVNTEQEAKLGTVGKPIAGTSVHIADDGEVLLSGEVVFRTYWNNDEATAHALQDGWYYTGDVGKLDDDGFLSITGRKKEILVTAGGKNVVPSTLEDSLKAHPLISQAMVVGDQRPYIAALITIDEDFFPTWKKQHDKPENATVTDLVDDPELRATVQAAIDDANRFVSQAESIRKFVILPTDFTEEGGEITPSLKVKRNVVNKNYAQTIESLYVKSSAHK